MGTFNGRASALGGLALKCLSPLFGANPSFGENCSSDFPVLSARSTVFFEFFGIFFFLQVELFFDLHNIVALHWDTRTHAGTQTHTHTHAHSHTHTHTNTYAHSLSLSLSFSLFLSLFLSLSLSLSLSHTHTQRLSLSLSLSCSRSLSLSQVRETAASEHAQLRNNLGAGVKEGEIPQGLITAICVHYSMVPGPETSELRRRLHTHKHVHIHMHTHAYVHTHTCTHTRRCTHAHECAHTQAHTQTHTHTCTRTHAHAHTHTRTNKHTHTYIYMSNISRTCMQDLNGNGRRQSGGGVASPQAASA